MKRLGKNIMLPALLLLAWFIAARFEIFSPYLLPSPQKTFSVFWALLLDGTLARHLAVSLLRVVGGFLCSCLVAMPLGLLCGRSRVLHDFLEPILEFLRHVPPLAAIPLIILWFGIDEASKLVVIFLASFFPLFLNTYGGIRNCDPKLLEVGTSLHFSAWQKARYIQLPAAVPSILIGLQLALGYSWRALIGAELIAASSGIGYMILDAEQMSRPDVVLVGLFSIGILGGLINKVFLRLTLHLLPWQSKAAAKL